MIKKTFLLTASAAALTAAPAFAHSAWLKPSTTVLSDQSQSVTVDAATSTEPFNADHNAMNTDDIKVWAPDGTMGKIENAARGRYRSTFDVKIDKPGTWRIGTQTSSVSGTFKLNGEDWRVGRMRGGMGPAGPGGAAQLAGPAPAAGAPPRPAFDPSKVVASVAEIPAGATDLNLTESQSRNEFFVTSGEPSATALQPTNNGLEMVPEGSPTDLVQNEPGKFRFLVDGKPAPGIKVKVIPDGQRYRESEASQELTTDAGGAISVGWPVAGFYWLNASLSDDKPAAARATKRRLSYTATLEVVAP
ncbi:MAG TPA: DUF4198 domain-containing protein [Novosphingobium sp.]|nr:DUF4198 domain-containing protein [Novosphingobium sp.]